MSMKAVNVLQTVRVADGGNIHGREIVKGTEDEVPEELFEGLEKAGYVEAVGRKKGKAALPDDGPTIAEYIAAGYPASSYPPAGYTSRSTEEEIATAVKAEEDAAAKAKADEKAAKALAKKRDAMLADLAVLSDDDLAKIVETEKVAVDAADGRDIIIGKIADARLAA